MTLCCKLHFSKDKNNSHINEEESLVGKNLVDEKPPSYFEKQRVFGNGAGTMQPCILSDTSPAAHLVAQPTIVIRAKPDALFRRTNRFHYCDVSGNELAHMHTTESGYTSNVFRLSKPLVIKVFDPNDNAILTLRKRFSNVNSRVQVYSAPNEAEKELLIGEVRQHCNLGRIKYDLLLAENSTDDASSSFKQFAKIDEPVFSTTFAVLNESKQLLGLLTRKKSGIKRALLGSATYELQMGDSLDKLQDRVPVATTLDQRAVLLAIAFSLDYDHFSAKSLYGS